MPGRSPGPSRALLRWGTLVDARQLRELVDAARGGLTDRELERRSGIGKGSAWNVLYSRRRWVTLDVADRILTRGLRRPDLMRLVDVHELEGGAGD